MKPPSRDPGAALAENQSPPARRRQVPELDGLRGIACGLVVLWHLVRMQLAPGPGPGGGVRMLLSQAWSGVDLFFALSGFLILGSLLDREGRGAFVGGFLRARCFRLLPAYLLLLAAFLAALAHYGSVPHSNTIDLMLADRLPPWTYATFTQNWFLTFGHPPPHSALGNDFLAVTWSLGAEVEFYLVALLVVVAVPRTRREVAFGVLAIASVVIRIALVFGFPSRPSAAFILPPAHFDAFAWGAVAACLYAHPSARPRLQAWLPRVSAFWILCALGVAWLTFHDVDAAGAFGGLVSVGWMALFYATSVAWVVLRSDRHPIPVLARGPLAWLGLISYSVFLFHLPVHYLFTDGLEIPLRYLGLPHGLAYLAAELSVTLAVGTISYLLVERPFIAWGRRWGRRIASNA